MAEIEKFFPPKRKLNVPILDILKPHTSTHKHNFFMDIQTKLHFLLLARPFSRGPHTQNRYFRLWVRNVCCASASNVTLNYYRIEIYIHDSTQYSVWWVRQCVCYAIWRAWSARKKWMFVVEITQTTVNLFQSCFDWHLSGDDKNAILHAHAFSSPLNWPKR